MIRALILLLALVSPALGNEALVSGLSQNRVQITANFDGSEILIYGAVKRDAPPPEGPPLAVIVTVEGPSTGLVIRRKEKVAGIWLNRSSVTVDAAPSFYAVATTDKLPAILSETEDLRHHITIPQVIRAVGISDEAENAPEFIAALERIRLDESRYRIAERSVQLADETLFRTDVALPANLTEGNYKVRLFILRGGKVLDTQERLIGVRKAGLERFLFNLAHQQPLLYGVLSLLMAAFAGWAASAAFRYIRT
ncbi:membrane protein [Cypionkella aquatica]|uniref:Membrane protein n=1 Tax=Cypionkella aquatica TaxID=1756042 RepID=A0AA37TU32_9RHOB|nr:TIGR02186 family protein [Cypionkella aquatica]GLS87554.1 membrane protein [Cypionkella aquatica]